MDDDFLFSIGAGVNSLPITVLEHFSAVCDRNPTQVVLLETGDFTGSSI